MIWAPSYKDIIHRRLTMFREVESDGRLIAAALRHYTNNPIDFIEDCCVTYDPRLKHSIMPFILFDRQKLFVQFLQECVQTGESGLAEKCRDAGMTWLCCVFGVWAWRFIPKSSIGFGSSKELKLDKIGDADSIFEKIRIIIRYLP